MQLGAESLSVALVLGILALTGWGVYRTNRDMLAVDPEDPNGEANADIRKSARAAMFPIYAAVVALFLFSLQAVADPDYLMSKVFGAGLLVFFAAILVGALLGLLFGIPRSRQEITAPGLLAQETGTPDGGQRELSAIVEEYAANTNLERISDWLATVLIGFGLAEISTIRTSLSQIDANLSPALMNVHGVSTVLVVYGLAAGFFLGYLLTVLFLPGALTREARARRRRQVFEQRQERKEAERALALELATGHDVGQTMLERMAPDDEYEFSRIVEAIRRDGRYVVSPDFKRDTALHETLRRLRAHHLIRPVNGGPWFAGQEVELTALGEVVGELLWRRSPRGR